MLCSHANVCIAEHFKAWALPDTAGECIGGAVFKSADPVRSQPPLMRPLRTTVRCANAALVQRVPKTETIVSNRFPRQFSKKGERSVFFVAAAIGARTFKPERPEDQRDGQLATNLGYFLGENAAPAVASVTRPFPHGANASQFSASGVGNLEKICGATRPK